jgi:teichuronic acid exporter
MVSTMLLVFEYGVFDSISETVVQRLDLGKHHVGAALFMSFTAAVAIAIFAALTSSWIPNLVGHPDLAQVIPWMAGGVAVLCLSSAHAGILRRQGKFHLISALSAISATAASLVGIFLLLSGGGMISLVAYFAIEKSILGVGTIAGAALYPSSTFSLRDVRDLVSYAAPIFGQRATAALCSQLDRYVIAAFWGADVVGMYQLATRLFDSLNASVLAPASKLFFVNYSRLQANAEQLRITFINSVQTTTLFTFPAFLGMSAVGPDVVRTLFGERWAASGAILQVLAIGGVPLVLVIMSGTVLSAVGRPLTYLKVEAATAALGLLLLAALPQFGTVGIAAAFVLREAAAVVIYAIVLRPIINISLRAYFGAFIFSLAAAGLMLVLVILIQATMLRDLSAPASITITALAGLAFYGLIVSIAGGPVVAPLMGVLNQVRRRRHDSIS